MQEIKFKDGIKKITDRAVGGLEAWIGRYTVDKDKPFSLKDTLPLAAKGILTATAAFLFARGSSVGGTKPFGIALLCAVGARAEFALAGNILAFLAGGDSVYGITSLLCFALRFLACRLLNGKRAPRWQEPLPLRMAVGASGGFTAGLCRILIGGFAKADLWRAFFLIAVIPSFVFLFGEETTGSAKGTGRQQLRRLSLLYAFVLGIGSFSLLAFAPDKAVALLLTLAYASRGGILGGCLAGLVGGLACGPVYSPMMALCGLAAGALKSKGSLPSLVAAVGTGGAFALCSQGVTAVTLTLPSLLWGGALYLPAKRLGIVNRLPIPWGEQTLPEEIAVSAAAHRHGEAALNTRLRAISDAMTSLSGVFYALSNRLASPGTYEVRELCEGAFKTYCASCRQNGICWGKDYDRTADLLNKLSDSVARHGATDASFIPADFLGRCPHAAKALSEINIRHARLLEQAARQNKTEIFALDYEAMASLLSEASEEHAEELKPDAKRTASAKQAAAELGMSWNNVVVYGTRRKTLVAGGIELSSLRHSAEELRSAFSRACGLPLSLPTFRIEDRYVTMTAVSAPIIACESARASLRKEEEAVNGDSAAVFENADGFYYALISDGMGSGSDAAVTSRIACIFLEKLLAAGNRKPTVLKMLNQVIRHKNVECFATVDLLEIDRLSGEASFIKGGAAASYILREGKLFKLESSSLPIGITREMSAEEIRFTLLPGDLIVMISDGVSQSFEDGIWLLTLLSEGIDPLAPLSCLARRILDEASRKNRRSDDMTVELIRIAEERDAFQKEAPYAS